MLRPRGTATAHACRPLTLAPKRAGQGELIDDLAAPTGSVVDTTMPAIYLMLWMALIFGATSFAAMSLIPYTAARITNNLRLAYLKAVLRQDSAFFDTAKPGEVVSKIADATLDFETGISVKLGEGSPAHSFLVALRRNLLSEMFTRAACSSRTKEQLPLISRACSVRSGDIYSERATLTRLTRERAQACRPPPGSSLGSQWRSISAGKSPWCAVPWCPSWRAHSGL